MFIFFTRRRTPCVSWYFFIFCSGADTAILEECSPGERTKYAGIGATVFFTAVMAAIAGSYALYTVFDNLFTAIFFGMIGRSIDRMNNRLFDRSIDHSIDRWIVRSSRPNHMLCRIDGPRPLKTLVLGPRPA